MMFNNEVNFPEAAEMPSPGTPAPEMPDFSDYFDSEPLDLISSLRDLWIRLAIWLRSLIVSSSAGLDDIQAIKDMLSNLPESFSAVLGKYFEPQEADRAGELLGQLISTAVALIAAEEVDEEQRTGQETVNLYNDAGRLAAYLASINPYWTREMLEELLTDYIEILLAGLVARLEKEYPREQTIFEYLLAHAVKVADYMAQGIMRKFRP